MTATFPSLPAPLRPRPPRTPRPRQLATARAALAEHLSTHDPLRGVDLDRPRAHVGARRHGRRRRHLAHHLARRLQHRLARPRLGERRLRGAHRLADRVRLDRRRHRQHPQRVGARVRRQPHPRRRQPRHQAAVSLHAYAPRLAAMTRYELVRGRLQVTSVEQRGRDVVRPRARYDGIDAMLADARSRLDAHRRRDGLPGGPRRRLPRRHPARRAARRGGGGPPRAAAAGHRAQRARVALRPALGGAPAGGVVRRPRSWCCARRATPRAWPPTRCAASASTRPTSSAASRRGARRSCPVAVPGERPRPGNGAGAVASDHHDSTPRHRRPAPDAAARRLLHRGRHARRRPGRLRRAVGQRAVRTPCRRPSPTGRSGPAGSSPCSTPAPARRCAWVPSPSPTRPSAAARPIEGFEWGDVGFEEAVGREVGVVRPHRHLRRHHLHRHRRDPRGAVRRHGRAAGASRSAPRASRPRPPTPRRRRPRTSTPPSPPRPRCPATPPRG